MKLAVSSQISQIDAYCAEVLGIPTRELMKKSGHAVAKVIRDRAKGERVVILSGKGNNGGDGYAAACEIINEYSVTVFDIFSEGQKTAEGKYFYSLFESLGGDIRKFDSSKETLDFIKSSSVIVDAIFGTGFEGEVPEQLRPLAIAIRESVSSQKIAVDVPLGVNADNGCVSDFVINVDATVELSLIKPGILSYPARSYVGEIVYDDLGIPLDKIYEKFPMNYNAFSREDLYCALPERGMNTHKGSFGKLLMIVGSEKYRGAAHLSAEAALRGGVGLVTYAGIKSLCSELSCKYPEIIYKEIPPMDDLKNEDVEHLERLSLAHSATLIGSGSSNTKGLFNLVLALLKCDTGAPLILDADAINALAENPEEGRAALMTAARPIVLTPHPLEFARLCGLSVPFVQQNRLSVAKSFSDENKVTLILKGAGTVIACDGEVYINTSGSSALAKAGSGDVLAGLLSALAAQPAFSLVEAAYVSVSLHSVAGDRLAKAFSSYGVTPSDLPKEIAMLISDIEGRAK